MIFVKWNFGEGGERVEEARREREGGRGEGERNDARKSVREFERLIERRKSKRGDSSQEAREVRIDGPIRRSNMLD